MKLFVFFVAGVLLGGLVVPWYLSEQNQIVQAETIDGLSVVTFASGITKVSYYDYDYAHPENAGWTIRTEIPALENPNYTETFLSAPQFISPSFVHQSEEHSWDHDVYVFDDTEMQGCARNVLYVDRVARTISTNRLAYCVTHSLDDSATTFFGKSFTGEEVVVGLYAGGSILHSVPVSADARFIAASEDGDRLLMFSGDCSPGGDTIGVLLWDVSSGTVEDVRSQVSWLNCASFETAVYQPSLERFDLYLNGNRVGFVQ